MSNKILVEVVIPASEQTMELFVSNSFTVGKMTEQLNNYFTSKSDRFLPTDETMLCHPETGEPYARSAKLEDAGIRNGSKLLFM